MRSLAPKDSPIFATPFVTVTAPLNTATSIDFAIACTQVPALYFLTSGGLSSIVSGYKKIRRLRKLLVALDQYRFQDFQSEDGIGPEVTVAMFRHGLTQDLEQAKSQFHAGFAQLLVAIAFLVFSLNSLHVRLPDHPFPVYGAVVSLLLGLSYFLCDMVHSVHDHAKNAALARRLKKKLRSTNGTAAACTSAGDLLNLAQKVGYTRNLMEALRALTSSPDTGASELSLQYPNGGDVKECVANDITAIRNALLLLRGDGAATTTTATASTAASEVEEEEAEEESTTRTPSKRLTRSAVKGSKKGSRASSSTSSSRSAAAAEATPIATPELLQRLDAHQRSEYITAALTSVYFLLNLTAGYGYLMPVLAYFAPHETLPAGSLVQSAVHALMLRFPSATADWWGNFAGDFAWTLEPALAIVSPAIVAYAFKVS